MVAPTRRTTFDGLTAGQTASVANLASGSGDAYDAASSNGPAVGSVAAAVRGPMGITVTTVAQTWFATYNFTGVTSVGCRVGLVLDANTVSPSATFELMQIRHSSGALTSLQWLAGGNAFRIANGAGGNATDLNGGTALPNGKYWIWMAASPGGTTATGSISATLRNANDDSLISNYSSSTQNVGTTATPIAAIRFGKNNATGNATFLVDDFAVVNDSLLEIDRPALPAGAWTVKKRVVFS